MRSRPHWTERNPKLVRTLLAVMKQLQEGQETMTKLQQTQSSLVGNKISLETLILDKVMTRIQAFGIENIEEESMNPFATTANRSDAMVAAYGKYTHTLSTFLCDVY
jgi:hypothetical protein